MLGRETENVQELLHEGTSTNQSVVQEIPAPAGQGTETLTTVPELLDFVNSFRNKKLGVCVDTCHVFASGILPSEALNICCSKPEWKSCVKLVHFNDSAKDKGCCVDRHAPIGDGKIPLKDLEKCAECCVQCDIPMLNE